VGSLRLSIARACACAGGEAYAAAGGGTSTLLTVNDALAVDASDCRELLWGDEFDQPAGSPPDPRWWKAVLGDGTAAGDPGWGNEELQVYTDNADNVVHDGQSNLVLTARRSAAGYSSARLITKGNVEVCYGKIE